VRSRIRRDLLESVADVHLRPIRGNQGRPHSRQFCCDAVRRNWIACKARRDRILVSFSTARRSSSKFIRNVPLSSSCIWFGVVAERRHYRK
jgi:hypothetical protein